MQIRQGVNVHFIQSKKFKDIGISIRFRCQLEKENVASRSLLALMLMDRCKKYNTKKKMSEAQDDLYGATLGAQTVGFGKSHVLEIRSKIINPLYLVKDNDLSERNFKFLSEVIFNPLFEKNIFDENKDILLSKINRMDDDPQQYVISCGLKEIGKGTPLGISTLGTYNDVNELIMNDVIQEYEKMIHENIIDILICGDFDEKEAISFIIKNFPFEDRNKNYASYYKVENKEDAKTTTYYKNISQSYVMMTWFTNTMINDKEYYALRVANGILGQYSTSFLFQEIREKRSLCYSIFSNLISYDGALGITTGIEQNNLEETISLIKQQFERVCQGNFDEELLSTTKRLIISSLKSSEDHMNSLMAFKYQNILLEKNYKIQDIIKCVNDVTKEDVVSAISKCVYKGTVILCKEDKDEKDI